MATMAPSRLTTTLVALRGMIMVIAGVVALIYPVEALTFLVFVAGGLLLVDGVLNLIGLDFAGPHDALFWVGVARSVFAILAGLAILFSPFLAPILSMTFLIWFVGLQAIAIGIIEVFELLKPGPKPKGLVGATLISGAAYALFGLVLLFLPMIGAPLVARIIGVLMLAFGASLFLKVWKQRTSLRTVG
jgi:uncharacterized membrane protein HdeD (DUF308 family)